MSFWEWWIAAVQVPRLQNATSVASESDQEGTRTHPTVIVGFTLELRPASAPENLSNRQRAAPISLNGQSHLRFEIGFASFEFQDLGMNFDLV